MFFELQDEASFEKRRREQRLFTPAYFQLACAVCPVYFLAAWLALPLTTPDGVAQYWPAAGIAVGALIVWGKRARFPIGVGVLAASFLANAAFGRATPLCIAFAFANTGEALLVAALVERWFKRPFQLDRLMSVLGLFAAAIVATAVWQAAAALMLHLAGQTSLSFIQAWNRLVWSNVSGIVITAPLMLGLTSAVRRPMPRRELLEGIGVLCLHALACLHAFGLLFIQYAHWMLLVPRIIQLPLLLWLALRCGPLFAAAGTFVLGAATIASTILGPDRFAGSLFTMAERAQASQYSLLAMSFVALAVASLIAERKDAESAARSSEARLKLGLHAGKLGTFEFNARTGSFEASRRARYCFGLPSGPPPSFEAIKSAIDPAEGRKFEDMFARAVEKGESFDTEFRAIWPDGSLHWLHIMGRAASDGEGGCRVAGAVRDVTEQKSIALLRESAEQMRLFVEQAPVAIAMFDREMRYLAASERWTKLHGLVRDDLIGRSHYEAVPDLPERWKDAHKRGLAGETVREEEDLFPKSDGRSLWIKWEVRPWRAADGTIGGILIFSEDITDRVMAERALRDSRSDLARAQAVAQIGSWRLDIPRNELIMSGEMCRIFGGIEGVSTYQALLAYVHPGDRERVDEEWKAALKGAPFDIECRIIAGGKTKWVQVKAELEFDDSGRLGASLGTIQDITQRKQAGERLRESEERLRLSNEAAEIGTFTIDPVTGRADFSEELATMLGIPGVTTAAVQDAFSRVHRNDAARAKAIYDLALKGANGGHLKMDFRFVRPGGEIRWITWTGRVNFRDGVLGREAFRVTGACVDITEIKQTERALRESEERLRHLGDSLPDSAVYQYSHDIEGKPQFHYMSAGVQKINGVSAEEVVADAGVLHRQILEDYLQPLYEAEKRSACDLSDFKMEVPMRRPDGEIRWMRLRSRPRRMQDGKVIWDGVKTDITEFKKAEDAVRASEERLRAIVSTAVDAIIVIDEAGLIQSINPACERMFGYTPSEITGKNVSVLMVASDRLVHDRYMEAYRKTGKAKIIGIGREVLHRRKDGSSFAGDLAVAEWHVDGRRYFTGTIRDVTERKRQEDKVQLLLREVNHRAKNMLALVRAIASQTAAPGDGEFVKSFSERLSALAASQDLLVGSGWQGVEISALVRSQLSHFASLIDGRIELSGPSLKVSAAAAQTIGMALHELATNAGKYGALSNGAGRITIVWQVERRPDGSDRFNLRWRELGGPKVTPPQRSGFGTTVIEVMPRMELDAEIRLNYSPDGLCWRLDCPAETILEYPGSGGKGAPAPESEGLP
jgi:PAS domain S-box-containing protein